MNYSYDFSGYATRNDIRCSDGRTIRRDAFKDNDGMVVPLVWQHMHDSPENVVGHALLENRADGVYTYGKFNDTPNGKQAKALVDNGDIESLSIYANRLKQNGGDVLHGQIREVSLVLSGANPGAYIDWRSLSHSDDGTEFGEALIYTEEPIELYHAEYTKPDSEEQKPEAQDNNKKGDSKMAEKTVKDVFDELTEEQKKVVYFLVGQAVKDAKGGGDAAEHYDMGGEYLKHNVFDNEEAYMGDTLSHSEMETIIKDGKRYGSLRDSFLAHSDEYGIENINYLFPDDKMMENAPTFIKRKDEWVDTLLKGVHHTPFSRIKSMFADITEDEARAKGYIKGHKKKDEVFTLLKRSTSPTTIYKKQKMDRDDIVDISDFDVVAWLKTEMRMMLDEEIARAILVGDGRLTSSDDHISTDCVRPIWGDDDLFVIYSGISAQSVESDFDGSAAVPVTAEMARAFIKQCVRARKDYKGSGTPVCYTTEDMLTECLLLEDVNGRVIYDSVEKLATAMRVSKIVSVPVLENLVDSDDEEQLLAIIVNPNDYNVGADKGGSVNMFDDFDIDYNQQKYLIETRCSGALTKPASAICISLNAD